jgi:hypothetical protein
MGDEVVYAILKLVLVPIMYFICDRNRCVRFLPVDTWHVYFGYAS